MIEDYIEDDFKNQKPISSLIILDSKESNTIDKSALMYDVGMASVYKALSCFYCNQLVFNDLLSCNNCWIVCCNDCKRKDCKKCGKTDVIYGPYHFFTLKLMNNLKVTCRKCYKRINYFELKSHLISCSSANILCKGCNISLKKDNAKFHLQKCPEILDNCRSCGGYIFKELIKDHSLFKCRNLIYCKTCDESYPKSLEHGPNSCENVIFIKNKYSLGLKVNKPAPDESLKDKGKFIAVPNPKPRIIIKPIEERVDVIKGENPIINNDRGRIYGRESSSQNRAISEIKQKHMVFSNKELTMSINAADHLKEVKRRIMSNYKSISSTINYENTTNNIIHPLEELTNINSNTGICLDKNGSVIIEFTSPLKVMTIVIHILKKFYQGKKPSGKDCLMTISSGISISNFRLIRSVPLSEWDHEIKFDTGVGTLAQFIKIDNKLESPLNIRYLCINDLSPYTLQTVSSNSEYRQFNSYAAKGYFANLFGKNEIDYINGKIDEQEKGICINPKEDIIFQLAKTADFCRLIIKPFEIDSKQWKSYFGRGSKIEVASSRSDKFREVGIVPQSYGEEDVTNIYLLKCCQVRFIKFTATDIEPFGLSFLKIAPMNEYADLNETFHTQFACSGEYISEEKCIGKLTLSTNLDSQYSLFVADPGYVLLELKIPKQIHSIIIIPNTHKNTIVFGSEVKIFFSSDGSEWRLIDNIKLATKQDTLISDDIKYKLDVKYIKLCSIGPISLKELII